MQSGGNRAGFSESAAKAARERGVLGPVLPAGESHAWPQIRGLVVGHWEMPVTPQNRQKMYYFCKRATCP